MAVHFVDTTEPSPLSHEILSGRPYTFLDDAPLEERRTRAVKLRRGLPVEARDLARLDPDAIARVRDESRPRPRDADELHDLLLGARGAVRRGPGRARARRPPGWSRWSPPGARAGSRPAAGRRLWFAIERFAGVRALFPDAALHPPEPGIELAPVSLGRRGGRRRARASRRVGSRHRPRPRRAHRASGARPSRSRWRRSRRRASRCAAASARSRPPEKPSRPLEKPRWPQERRRRMRGRARRPRERSRKRRRTIRGVLRPPAAGAHPRLHPGSPAPGDRAGHRTGLHALPAALAARHAGHPDGREHRGCSP